MAYRTTGYQASAQTIAFNGTQTIDSLTDGEYTDESDAIDNSSSKYAMADFYLDLASVAYTAEGTINLYILPTVDGTNYPTWTGNTATAQDENEQYHVGSMTTPDATSVFDGVVRNVVLPVGKFKVAVKNDSGVTLGSSGNTLYYRPHSVEDA